MKTIGSRQRWGSVILRSIAQIISASIAASAMADINNWIDGTSLWSIDSNWSLGHAPAGGDEVQLLQSDATNRIATITSDTALIADVTVDATGTSYMELSMGGATLSNAGSEYIGYSGRGLFSQSSGINSIGQNLYIGYASSSTGSNYTLNGGTLSAATIYIANSGSGTFTEQAVQGGPANIQTTVGDIIIANNVGARGTLVSAGGLSSANNLYVGGNGSSSGGTGAVLINGGTVATNTLKVWPTTGSIVTLQSGTLQLNSIDLSGDRSRFSWTAGTLNFTTPGGFALSSANIGPNLGINIGQTLSAYTVSATSGTLGLNGGQLIVDHIDPATVSNFQWSSGTLMITSPDGLTVSSSNIGAHRTLFGQLIVPGTVTFPAGTSMLIGSGGALSAGALDLSANPGAISWTAGGISITGSGTFASSTLATNLTLPKGKQLTINDTLSITDGNSVALSGGSLVAGKMMVSPNSAGFTFSSGYLQLNAPLVDLTTMPPNFSVSTFCTLDVPNTINIPSGSSFTISGNGIATAGAFTLNGNANLTNGTLILNNAYIGSTGSASVLQINTSATVSGSNSIFAIGLNPGSSGTYSLTGGTLNTSQATTEYIGDSGTGTFLQSGGSHSASANVYLGYNTGSVGTYSLSAGTTSISNIYLGKNGGSGNLLVSGGTMSVAGTCEIDSPSSGISLTGGTLSVHTFNISAYPTAFTWSAGTLDFSYTTTLSNTTSFNINSGQTLSFTNLFFNSGGSITLNGGNLTGWYLDTSSTPGALVWNSGTISLSNGTGISVSNIARNLVLAKNQILNISNNLQVPSTACSLTVSGGTATAASVTMDSGGSAVITAGSLKAVADYIGSQSAGSLTQSAGINTAGSLVIGYASGSTGTYYLSGIGTNLSTTEYIGSAGTGTLNHSGGSNLATTILIGCASGSTGTLSQSGGTSNASTFSMGCSAGAGGSFLLSGTAGVGSSFQYIGSAGTGTLTQTGGINNAGTRIEIAYGSASVGTVSQSGGTLTSQDLILADLGGSGAYNLFGSGNLSVGSNETIGSKGSGTFNQSAGAHTVGGQISLASSAGAHGIYNLSGGTASAKNIYVGGKSTAGGGAGILDVTGGSLNVSQSIKLYNTSNSGIILAGGTLATPLLDVSANPLAFSWTAGTLAITGAAGFFLSSTSVGTTLNLPAGKALSVTNQLSLPTGTSLSVNGGSVAASAMAVIGASVAWNSGSLSTSAVSMASASNMTIAAHGANPVKTLVLASLSVDANSKLDLGNNALIVNYSGASPVGSIRGYITSAFDGSAWDGPGLSSSSAANDMNYLTALGYAEASDLGIDSGQGTFAGQSIPGEAVLVKYTYYGDSNLDGVVTTDDFFAFVAGFNGQGSGWAYGDYNYDGVIDTSDLFIFVPVFNSNTENNPLSELILNDANLSASQKAAMLSVVPEPTSLGVLALGAGAMGIRRRRK